tara:strand:+ start:322 stop:687 length:366 start_codon:yes stop_codon:yes gene_type:complete
MSQGFTGREANAERSLEKSSKQLKALRKVIEQFKDDPKGKKKMLKKMKKYWKSPIAEIKGLDYKPKGADYQLPEDLQQDLGKMAEYIDPREEEGTPEEVALTPEQETELRDRLTKTQDTND